MTSDYIRCIQLLSSFYHAVLLRTQWILIEIPFVNFKLYFPNIFMINKLWHDMHIYLHGLESKPLKEKQEPWCASSKKTKYMYVIIRA